MTRDQSEDYSSPENVLVYRDAPHAGGYRVGRVIDELPRVGSNPIELPVGMGDFVPATWSRNFRKAA